MYKVVLTRLLEEDECEFGDWKDITFNEPYDLYDTHLSDKDDWYIIDEVGDKHYPVGMFSIYEYVIFEDRDK